MTVVLFTQRLLLPGDDPDRASVTCEAYLKRVSMQPALRVRVGETIVGYVDDYRIGKVNDHKAVLGTFRLATPELVGGK